MINFKSEYSSSSGKGHVVELCCELSIVYNTTITKDVCKLDEKMIKRFGMYRFQNKNFKHYKQVNRTKYL